MDATVMVGHDSHPAFGHLVLLVFEAVMEVVCVALPGFLIASQGLFTAEHQKFVANLNVTLFTPCLIFTKLASQLDGEKLVDLAIIPVLFILQTLVSYGSARGVSKAVGLKKRASNFVTAMAVFGNSNSLPISLVISLSKTLSGLHWDRIPNDNDEEVGARGILYLLIFQQLGQLVRWSWGYHILLAPPEKYNNEAIEEGRYRDDPEEDLIPGLDGQRESAEYEPSQSGPSSAESSGPQTPVLRDQDELLQPADPIKPYGDNGEIPELPPSHGSNDDFTSFPFPGSIGSPITPEEDDIPPGVRGWVPMLKLKTKRSVSALSRKIDHTSQKAFRSLPQPAQTTLTAIQIRLNRFLSGLWEFMNPPLWAMLAAIIVASVPSLQETFFTPGTFINNSITRAVEQSGQVAVPLILVVLGANLARNTLPEKDVQTDNEETQIGTKLLISSLVSRMVIPTIVMAPIIALAAKFVPVSIVDDPIFVIVAFLLTGAPSALQLAQICQINGVYEGTMSKILFQGYVIWILPSTLILVMAALEVVEWVNA